MPFYFSNITRPPFRPAFSLLQHCHDYDHHDHHCYDHRHHDHEIQPRRRHKTVSPQLDPALLPQHAWNAPHSNPCIVIVTILSIVIRQNQNNYLVDKKIPTLPPSSNSLAPHSPPSPLTLSSPVRCGWIDTRGVWGDILSLQVYPLYEEGKDGRTPANCWLPEESVDVRDAPRPAPD